MRWTMRVRAMAFGVGKSWSTSPRTAATSLPPATRCATNVPHLKQTTAENRELSDTGSALIPAQIGLIPPPSHLCKAGVEGSSSFVSTLRWSSRLAQRAYRNKMSALDSPFRATNLPQVCLRRTPAARESLASEAPSRKERLPGLAVPSRAAGPPAHLAVGLPQ
jgi:hypothetical protein